MTGASITIPLIRISFGLRTGEINAQQKKLSDFWFLVPTRHFKCIDINRMENKIYIRRCERFTIYQATDPVEIDIEKLKRCDPPYGGNSHSELLGYVQENLIDDWENWASNETNKEIFGESIDDLCIDYFEFHQYSDSRNKYGDFWNEAGVPNGELRKTGGFEILESSAD